MKIVTAQQMREIENRCFATGISSDELMESAGKAVARCAFDHVRNSTQSSVGVLVGPGNNGGDSLIAAKYLYQWGAEVNVFICGERSLNDEKLVSLSQKNLAIYDTNINTGAEKLRELLPEMNVVVDGIFGLGFNRPIGDIISASINAVNNEKNRRHNLIVISVDVPSGLNSDTGSIDINCIYDDVTCSLGRHKLGFYRFPGAKYVGKVEVNEIGILSEFDGCEMPELMTHSWAERILPPRPLDAHKGDFGRILIIGGSKNYIGAPSLAAIGALRVGAGLVTVAVPEGIFNSVAVNNLEPTYVTLPEITAGVLSPEACNILIEEIPKHSVVVIGCGLGLGIETQNMLESILYDTENLPPVVVDADGLNLLSRYSGGEWSERFKSPAIVTPHPGEMRRLWGKEDVMSNEDRLIQSRMAARLWNKTVVLKGPFTITASAEGYAMVSPFANPSLATAGTGDVLSGVIAGFLAQGLSLMDAGSLGVYVHGLAGSRLKDGLGDAGTLAGDLLPILPRVIKEIKELIRN
ncbi:MAG: NAD(P)H-hydrate dehydratase [SAR202 cluster bacterium]|nr:NAD(P)H-hydrate dehydratase [SAR202 cluster bacterium]